MNCRTTSGPSIAFDVFAHPAVKPQLIDPMPLLDRLGAREFLVFPDVELSDSLRTISRTLWATNAYLLNVSVGSAMPLLPLVFAGRVCILPKFKPGNGAIVDLVRTVGEPQGAHQA